MMPNITKHEVGGFTFELSYDGFGYYATCNDDGEHELTGPCFSLTRSGSLEELHEMVFEHSEERVNG